MNNKHRNLFPRILILIYLVLDLKASPILCYDPSFSPIYLRVQEKSCKYNSKLENYVKKYEKNTQQKIEELLEDGKIIES